MPDTEIVGPITAGDGPPEEVELALTALGPGRFRLEAVHGGSPYHATTLSLEDEDAIAEFAAAAAAKAEGRAVGPIEPDSLIRRLGHVTSDLAASGALAAYQVDAEDEAAGVLRAPDDPHRLARIYLVGRHRHPDRATLVHRGGEFLAWDGRRYAEDREVTPRLTAAIGLEFARRSKEQGAASEGAATPSRAAAAPEGQLLARRRREAGPGVADPRPVDPGGPRVARGLRRDLPGPGGRAVRQRPGKPASLCPRRDVLDRSDARLLLDALPPPVVGLLACLWP